MNGGVIQLTASIDTNAVPEPSTWALLALGAAGLLYLRKRK
ncbi:MAG: PEP-CTERM sorting domain-containing protein [Thermoguttaceae bacterium]|nr:PEP-CTERM sorting domain-containing protein [Thermoguttaceae bacterium]